MTAFEFGGPSRFAHQRRGLRKMIDTGGQTALLFDPGLGKTAVVLDYASLLALKSTTGEARILVVAPLAAVDTWVIQSATYISPQVNYWAEALGGSIRQRAEALASRGGNPFNGTPGRGPYNRWHGPRAAHHAYSIATGFRADGPATQAEGPDGIGTSKPRLIIEIINIDTLSSRLPLKQGSSRTSADLMLDAVKRYNPDLIVIDESHKIKSANANASRLLARMVPFVRRRVLLTGTVMPHSPMDVFGQWRFLDPYAFGTKDREGVIRQATFSGFRYRFARMGGFMGKEVVGFQNLDEMQTIMARNAVVAKKSEALDLPPTTDTIVTVHLTPAEKKAYAEMKQQLAAQLASGALATVPNRLTQMMRLRQITSGFVPDDNGAINILGTSKASTISSIVHDNLAGENRIVIFAHFRHEIDLLVRTLAKKGTEVVEITGATPPEERALIRKRFGSDEPTRIVIVAQIKTMSLAVNELVTASHAVFASLSQQRDDLIQAQDRLNRIGQTKPVTFWYALAPGTVDEVILDSHKQRSNLETAMLNHIQSQQDL